MSLSERALQPEVFGFVGVLRFTNQVAINLAANIAQGTLAIALIPLATRVLGPADYGVYGMAMVVVGLIVALCETGAVYVLYGHYSGLDRNDRRELLSTLITLSATAGTLAACLLWVLWPALGRFDSLLASLSSVEMLLVCLVVPMRTVWAMVNPILIAQARSHWVAASVLGQAVAVFAVVLVALFVFGQERTALFWGNLAGAFACVVLALLAVGRSGWGRPRLHWLRKVATLAPGAWFAGLVENVRATVESSAVARAAGSAGLGNYNHARLYYGSLMQGTNAFANVLWPFALQDARDSASGFVRLRVAWNVVYLGLTLAGLVFVFFGEAVIHWLTNGKFDHAAAWVPFLVMYLLIQNSGKPATAVLYAANLGNAYSTIRIVSTSLAVAAIVLLVPQFGVAAAICVAMLEMVVTRVLVQVMARQVRETPFQDQWVILGCLVIGTAWELLQEVVLSGAARAVLLLLICALLLFLAGRSVSTYSGRDVSGYLRELFRVKETHV